MKQKGIHFAAAEENLTRISHTHVAHKNTLPKTDKFDFEYFQRHII